MIEIKSLAQTDRHQIVDAIQDAFADYVEHLEKDEIFDLLQRRGFDEQHSFAAFDDDQIAGFTLNGVGLHEGISTAYDTATGVLPAYRGWGLTRQIFEFSLPRLHQMGIRQYLLQVVNPNYAALKVYRDAGFTVKRVLNCYKHQQPQWTAPVLAVDIVEAPTTAVLQFENFHNCRPSWQSDADSIQRAGQSLKALIAQVKGRTVGYCVFDAKKGDLSLIAVHPQHRRKGIGSALLARMYQACTAPAVRCLNIEESCHSLHHFLLAHGFAPLCQNYEMIRKV